MDVPYDSAENGIYVADAPHVCSRLIGAACDAGVKFLQMTLLEDVVVHDGRLTGVVVNWSAVGLSSLHVDPLTIRSSYVIDATGHAAEVVRMLEGRVPMGPEIKKEAPLWAEKGEEAVVENTREVYPGLLVAGMAANAVFGAPRMGPVFGGMLLSGKKAAQLVCEGLKG